MEQTSSHASAGGGHARLTPNVISMPGQSLNSDGALPLTPALSLKERENRFPSLDQFGGSRLAQTRDAALPTPAACSAGVPPASIPGVPPGDSPGGETPPELAAEDGCATWVRAKNREIFSSVSLPPAGERWGAGERNELSPDTQFNELALDLFALQFTHVAPYRAFCKSRRVTPDSITDWRQIPALPTAAFKDFELTSLPEQERHIVFHSSGTTGQRPSRHFHNADSLALYEASLRPWFQAHLLANPNDCGKIQTRISSPNFQLICLTPPPAKAPHSSLVHMFESVRRELGATASVFTGTVDPDGAWRLDLPKTLACLHQAISTNQSVVLLGTAFSYVHLLDQLAEQKASLTLPSNSRVLETGGYKGRSRTLPKVELHALITRFLGLPPGRIVCEYGMSELSSQAYDRVATDGADAQLSTINPQRLLHFPPWTRGQIISPESGREVAEGETGLLRVYDLANVRSVMALQTEDLAIRRGDGFELIGRATLAEPRGCSLMASPVPAAP